MLLTLSALKFITTQLYEVLGVVSRLDKNYDFVNALAKALECVICKGVIVIHKPVTSLAACELWVVKTVFSNGWTVTTLARCAQLTLR